MLLYFLMQDVPSRKYAIVLLHAWSTMEEVCYFTYSCRMYPWRKYAIVLTHAGCTHEEISIVTGGAAGAGSITAGPTGVITR